MIEAGLVLEGGGMRGVYSAGVTDFFLDQGILFSDVYGVSAGSCVACSYLAQQRGRGYRVWAEYVDNDAYCSMKNLVKTGEIFEADFVYNRIPNELDPYDYDAYAKYEGRFYAVVTNAKTGEAEYLPIRDMHKDIRKVRASSSLPLLAKVIWIDGKPYMDGGIADSIPIAKAQADGVKKNVVILTREAGYVKKPSSLSLVRMRYRNYPKMVETLGHRHENYNATLQYVKQEEEKGSIFVIRPSRPVTISRLEKNVDKLKELYEEGYADAKANFEAMKLWLGIGDGAYH